MTDPRLSQTGRCPTCESPDMFWHKEVAGKLCADSWHLTRNDLLSRVKEMEAERDEARQDAKLMVCCYCGKLREKPQPFDKEVMCAEIVEHLKSCPTHPANQLFIALDRAEAAESRLAAAEELLQDAEFLAKIVDDTLAGYEEGSGRKLNFPTLRDTQARFRAALAKFRSAR